MTSIPPSPWRVRCAACGTVHAGPCPELAQPTVAVRKALGGGYEGLQAIARAALAADERRNQASP